MKSPFLKRFLEETVAESLGVSRINIEMHEDGLSIQEHARAGHTISIRTALPYLYYEEAIAVLKAIFSVEPEYRTRIGIAVGTHAGVPSASRWDFEISWKPTVKS